MNYYYIQNGFIHFNFKFDTELIASIKQITGRVFNPETKEWYVPLTITNGTPINTIITKFKFEKRDHTSLLGEKSTFELEKIDPIEMENLKKELLSKGLGISPRGEFQWEGIYWMSVWGSMILGDLMGLGKTPQTIFTAELNDWFPCLVICPASTKYQWRDLWLKANPKRIIDVIESQRNNNWDADVVIINWDLLSESDGTKISRGKEVKNIVPKFNELLRDWKYCVFDELHMSKNSKAGRSQLALKISNKSKYVAKFNKLLKKWKDYYSQFEENKVGIRWLKDEFINTGIYSRWQSLGNITKCYYDEINVR